MPGEQQQCGHQQAEKNAFLRRYIGSICKLNFRSMQDEAYRKVLFQFRRRHAATPNRENLIADDSNDDDNGDGASLAKNRHRQRNGNISAQDRYSVNDNNDDNDDVISAASPQSRPWFIEKELSALKEALPQLWCECSKEKHAFVNKIRQLLSGTLYSSATAFIFSIPYGSSRRGEKLSGRHRCGHTGTVRDGQFTIRLMTSSHAFGSLEGNLLEISICFCMPR